MRSVEIIFACLLLGCGSGGATEPNSPASDEPASDAAGAAMTGAGGVLSNGGSAGNVSAAGGNAGNANAGNAGSGNAAGRSMADASASGGSLNAGGTMVTGGPGRDGGASASGCGTSARKNGFEGRPRACVSSGVCDALTPRGKYAPEGTPPDLKMGVLTDLGPPFGPITDGGNALSFTFDPNNTAILYVGVEARNGPSPNTGLWRSKDGGATWKVLGTGKDDNIYDCQTSYIDLPINIRVDPLDSDHIYVTEGVRGAGNGFWVSWDGGETWTRAYSEDLTALSVDPCDFCHAIVGSHSQDPIGVLETTDGGYSWVLHPPGAGVNLGGGSYGVNFLYDPLSGQGDAKTWLVQGGGMWKTQDAGTSWTKVSDIGGIHGFTTVYYAKNGDVYSGSGSFPARSSDNGATWQASSQGLPSAVYYGITGDGTNLYAMPDGFPPSMPMMTSKEDGLSWTEYGDKQKLARGMQHPRFDPKSGILYFVNNMTLHAERVALPQ